VELQSRFLSPPGAEDTSLLDAERKPANAATVTVRLPSGQTVSGTLLELDAFDVAFVDTSGWYRSYSRSDVTVTIQDPLEAHRQLLPKYSDAVMHDMLAYLETLK
jgi:cytochrome c oxidase cbb3-type subunit 3